MEFEIETNIAPIYGVTSLLSDAISKKYEFIDDMNSLKINAEDEELEDLNPVIDSIIEDENNHIGRLQQLIDLMNNSEDAIAEGKAETIEIIDNPEIMESMKMAKKLRLNENFDNVIDDVQAVADPVFVGANEEHDENKKKYEDAIKENEKAAEETIPKEGDTGKEVKSAELKKMKLSEDLGADFAQSCADDVAEYMLTEFVDLTNSEIRQVLSLASKHFDAPDLEEAFDPAKKGDIFNILTSDLSDSEKVQKLEELLSINESLNEDIQRYSDVVPKEDRKYWYFTTHGVGPGSVPKDLTVLEVKEGQNDNGTWGDYVCLDGVLNTSELKKYDMIEKAPMNESLEVSIAKEQIKRFTEGKMPKNWTVDNYLKKLTENKHITSKEATSLKEWYNGKQSR